MPGFCDKQIDVMFEKASKELDDNKRALIGQDIDGRLAEELPALPLYF